MTGKWIIAVAAFVYLLSEGMFSSAKFSFSPNAVPWLLASVACVFLAVFGTAARFHLVLRQLGQPSRLTGVVRMFFGGLLPQQIGSDFAFDGMRLVMLHKQGIAPAMIGTSVLADRLFGVSTTFLIAFFLSAYYIEVKNIQWVLVFCLGVLAAIPVCFILLRRVYASSADSFLFRIPGARLAVAMGEVLEALLRKPIHIVFLSFFSFLPVLAMFFASYCNSRALMDSDLSCGEAMTGAAFAALTAILPLPLAGIGVGEGAFGWVVSTLRGNGEAADYAPIFFMSRFSILTIGFVSWVAACASKQREKHHE